MAKTLKVRITARGYELDSYNHVNNAVYLNYLEHARWEFFRVTGLSELLRTRKQLPVVTEIRVRYQREIRLFDELEIESRCTAEKPYLVFRQRIVNLTTGFSAARADTKLIFLDGDRMAGEIPEEILTVIQAGND